MQTTGKNCTIYFKGKWCHEGDVHATSQFALLLNLWEKIKRNSYWSAFSYLEEDIKDVGVGAREEDDGEEGADAAVEHRGPDLGQRLLNALVPAPCGKLRSSNLFQILNWGSKCHPLMTPQHIWII